MIGGKGEANCVAGIRYYTDDGSGLTRVRECVEELEKTTQKPHHVERGCQYSSNIGRDRTEQPAAAVCYEKIVADEACQKGVLYDDWVGSNEPDAKQCAAELARITGREYKAKQVAQRKIFAAIYKVVASKSK